MNPRPALPPAFRAAATLGIVALALLLAVGLRSMSMAQQPGEVSPALERARTWPDGIALMAATGLDLRAGEYEWQMTQLTAQETPGSEVIVEHGVLIAISGPVLVQVNGEDVVRVEQGRAMLLRQGDRILPVSETTTPVDVELVEIVRLADANPARTPDQAVPISITEGAYTLMLMDVPSELNDGATPQRLIEGATRPGVSIAHTENAIPAQLDPTVRYALWIAALFPNGQAPAPTAGAPTTAAISVTASPTATIPTGSPTAMATATAPATTTATATTTVTATATATATPTNTPTATPSPTPTNTPTVTPSPTPTNTPTPTDAA